MPVLKPYPRKNILRLGSRFIAVFWGFAEAICFFIVPDVFLSYLAISDYRKAIKACFYCVTGALVGGVIMYTYGYVNSASALRFLDAIPAISPTLIQQSKMLLSDGMFLALLEGSITGTPYKIFAVHAGSEALSLAAFVLYSVPARLFRFLIVTTISAAISTLLLKNVSQKNKKRIHLALWSIFYIGYFYCMEW